MDTKQKQLPVPSRESVEQQYHEIQLKQTNGSYVTAKVNW